MDDQTTAPAPAPEAAEKVAPSIELAPAPRPTSAPAPSAELLDDATWEGSVENDKTAHYRTSSTHTASAWIQGPGAVTLLAEAGRDLNEVSALRGIPVTRVEFVRTRALPAIKSLLIWPTDEADPNKIPVTWRDGHASFNASDVLVRGKIPVESGRKKRFEVSIAKETKVGPALKIDMRYLMDLRIIDKGSSSAKGKGKKAETSNADVDLSVEE